MMLNQAVLLALTIACVFIALICAIGWWQLAIRHKMAKNDLNRVRKERDEMRQKDWLHMLGVDG